METYAIFYRKDPKFICDPDLKYWDVVNEVTHTRLCYITVDKLSDVFTAMQGEVWSPNGQAREFIKERDLNHTSMSIGDVAVELIDGKTENYGRMFQCKTTGWIEVGG